MKNKIIIKLDVSRIDKSFKNIRFENLTTTKTSLKKFYLNTPEWIKNLSQEDILLSEEISKTRKQLGNELTGKLLEEFKYEANSQTLPNVYYIINKLRAARFKN